MSKNKKIGEWGEDLAVNYLKKLGYSVVTRNYRYSRFEIDLIVKKGDLLVFIEVKTRSGTRFGYPEEWVDVRKIERILEASENFIFENDWRKKIRFDIIAILSGEGYQIKHFQDAFH